MSNRTIIHIDRDAVAANGRPGPKRPILSVTSPDGARQLGYSVEILGPSRVVYRPLKPLETGVHAWIETEAEVIVT